MTIIIICKFFFFIFLANFAQEKTQSEIEEAERKVELADTAKQEAEAKYVRLEEKLKEAELENCQLKEKVKFLLHSFMYIVLIQSVMVWYFVLK